MDAVRDLDRALPQTSRALGEAEEDELNIEDIFDNPDDVDLEAVDGADDADAEEAPAEEAVADAAEEAAGDEAEEAKS